VIPLQRLQENSDETLSNQTHPMPAPTLNQAWLRLVFHSERLGRPVSEANLIR
jgi:hypothetical protein